MAEVFYTWSKVPVMQRNSAVHEQPIYIHVYVYAYNCTPDVKQLKQVLQPFSYHLQVAFHCPYSCCVMPIPTLLLKCLSLHPSNRCVHLSVNVVAFR